MPDIRMLMPRYFVLTVMLVAASHQWVSSADVPGRWAPAVRTATGYTTVLDLNGQFEESADGAPGQWQPAPGKGKGWTVSPEAAHGGKQGIQADTHASDTAPFTSAPFAVRPGDAVAFYLWARCTNEEVRPLTVAVQVETDGAWRVLQPTLRVLPSSTWRDFGGVPAFIPHGATSARFVISVNRTRLPAVWQIDDLAAWVTSFSRYAETRREQPPLENFAIFGIDTLRQNTLGCYGADRNATPSFDAIAAEGRLYEEVTSSCPWTPPSWASILTSLYPSQHKAEFRVTPIAEEARTLPEILRERGYFTVGIVTSGDLDGLLGEKKDFHRGFDIYFQHGHTEHVGKALSQFLDGNRAALQRFRQGGLFIFWHCYDPHLHYVNHHPDTIRNEGGKLGTVDILDSVVTEYNARKNVLSEDLKYIKAVYDSEVMYVDNWLRDYQLRLKRFGLWEDLNVVVCSDHGEAFDENGRWKHSVNYETIVRTPLIFRLPGRIPPGERAAGILASNLDILPTLLDVADVPSPSHAEGRSLLEPQPDAHTAKVGISECKLEGWLSIREARYKLVASNVTNRNELPPEQRQNPDKVVWTIFTPAEKAKFELYDLREDPAELHNLADAMPDMVDRLKAMLKAHMERTSHSAFGVRPQVEESEETAETLRALGYL